MASGPAFDHSVATLSTQASGSAFDHSVNFIPGKSTGSAFDHLVKAQFMGIRAKQMTAGTFGATVAGRAPFGADIFDLTTATSVFAAGSIPAAKLVSGSVTETQLAASVAGDGLTGGGGSALAVNVGVGLEIDSDNVRISAAAAGAGLAGGAGSALAVGSGTGITVNANDVALELATGAPTYSGTHVSTFPVDALQVTGTPDSANDAVNKSYVDSLANGTLWKEAVQVSTDAILSGTPTYDNGTGGVGATLTAAGSGVLTVDGVATVFGDRILVKDQDSVSPTALSGLQNGIYEVTIEGDGGTAYELTRTTDSDNSPGNELEAAAAFVIAGTVNAGLTFVQTEVSVTVGTDVLTWTQSAGASAASAGAGLTASGNVFNVGAGDGINVNSDDVAVDALDASISVAAGGISVNPAALIQGGAQEVDGDLLDIDYVQSNYTPATTGIATDVNQLAAHLEGIDDALAAVGGTAQQESLTTEVITGADTALGDTLTFDPISDEVVRLYLNGVLQVQGAGADYTLGSGTFLGTITWLASSGTAVDMAADDVLIAVYES